MSELLKDPENIGELRRHLKNDNLAVMFGKGFFSVMYKEDDDLIATTIQRGADKVLTTAGDFHEVLQAMDEIVEEYPLPKMIYDRKENVAMHVEALLIVQDWFS